MILRIFRATALHRDRQALVEHLRDVVYPAASATPGLRSFQAGIRGRDDASIDFVLVSTWTDFAALTTGIRDLDRPAWLANVVDRYRTLAADHYELVGEEIRGLIPMTGGVLAILEGRLGPPLDETYFQFARRRQQELLDSGLAVATHIGRRVEDRTDRAVFVAVSRDEEGARGMAGATERPLGDRDWERFFADWEFGAYDALAKVPGVDESGSAATRSSVGSPHARPTLLLADDDRRYVFASSAAEALLGRPVSRLLGLRLDEVAPPEMRDEIPALWSAFLERGSLDGPFDIARPDGSIVHVEFHARANRPWPGTHVSILAAPSTPVDVDLELAAAGLIARYAPAAAG